MVYGAEELVRDEAEEVWRGLPHGYAQRVFVNRLDADVLGLDGHEFLALDERL